MKKSNPNPLPDSTNKRRTLNCRIQQFGHRDLIVHEAPKSSVRDKFDAEKLKFGSQFSDHILEVEWTSKNGWGRPVIQPMHDLMLHPAAKVLHYAIELFEGLKAYRGADNKIRLFRPELNMHRMVTSAKRVCLPTLLKLNELRDEPCGFVMLFHINYAPTILTSKKAQDLGCQQVLWLFGEEHYLTEVGTMNIFVLLKNKNGETELVTPPLDSGLILHGITRRCLLELAREWKEFKVSERPITMKDITQALKEDRYGTIAKHGWTKIVAECDEQAASVSRAPYQEKLKSLQLDIERLFKRINELSVKAFLSFEFAFDETKTFFRFFCKGIQESDTGLLPKQLWDIASDFQAKREEDTYKIGHIVKILFPPKSPQPKIGKSGKKFGIEEPPRYVVNFKQSGKYVVDFDRKRVRPKDLDEGMRVA
uniref:Branched-chain-amino-acid aminotransferase n=1 Tax=Romanomermis culicivorax TaxID=13658 RepID=A0A915J8B8_ROMCU